MKSESIVGIVIGVVIFTALVPTIFDSIFATTTPTRNSTGSIVAYSNVSGASATLIGLVGLVIVAGFLMYAYKEWQNK